MPTVCSRTWKSTRLNNSNSKYFCSFCYKDVAVLEMGSLLHSFTQITLRPWKVQMTSICQFERLRPEGTAEWPQDIWRPCRSCFPQDARDKQVILIQCISSVSFTLFLRAIFYESQQAPEVLSVFTLQMQGSQWGPYQAHLRVHLPTGQGRSERTRGTPTTCLQGFKASELRPSVM